MAEWSVRRPESAKCTVKVFGGGGRGQASNVSSWHLIGQEKWALRKEETKTGDYARWACLGGVTGVGVTKGR